MRSQWDEGFGYYMSKRVKSVTTRDNAMKKVSLFTRWMEDNGIATEDLQYQHMMEYIDHCRDRGNTQNTIIDKIRYIRYWCDYRYLIPNPCYGINMPRHPSNPPAYLLNESQLHKMYYEHPQYSNPLKRDKVALGLMIYQGMEGSNMKRLRVDEINLERQFIIISSKMQEEKRSISVHSEQLPLLMEYVYKVRGELLKKSPLEPSLLIVKDSYRTTVDLSNFLKILYKRLRLQCETFRSVRQVRASVIISWLQHYNLREAQYMAGHRYVSTTEKYLKSNVEDLQQILDKYHPSSTIKK